MPQRPRKTKSERRKAENGFEAQERKKEELGIQNERNERKKEHHEWDIRLKRCELGSRVTKNLIANVNATIENPGFEAQFAAEMARHLENSSPEVARAAAYITSSIFPKISTRSIAKNCRTCGCWHCSNSETGPK